MRLIDADALKEKAYSVTVKNEWHMNESIDVVDVEDVDNMPTVDAVPVVRCSYCKFFEEEEDGGECGITDMWMSDNDYCSLAERIGSHETN